MAMISDTIASMVQGMTQQVGELRLPTQGDLQANAISHPVYGLGKRTGTDHMRKLVGVTAAQRPFLTWVDRDSFEKHLVIYDGTYIRVYGLDGRQYPVVVEGTSLSYLACSEPRRDIVGIQLADTTLLLNRTKFVSMKSTTTDAIGTPTAIVWVRSGNYGQTYTIRLEGTDYSFTTSTTDVTQLATSYIATQLAAAVTGVAGFTVTYTAGDSYLTIKKADNTDFTIEVRDSVGGASVGVCKHQAKSFADLPPIAPDGYTAKVLGSPDDSADDYWVRFDAFRSGAVSGSVRGEWVECTAPETAYELNPASLPHKLVRLRDDFDGTVTGQAFAIYFKLEPCEWADRLVGDDETNPNPSFVGRRIRGMYLFQSRLGFVYQSYVAMSRTNDLFNFWRGTVTQVLDDDPIDYDIAGVYATESRTLNLDYALVYSEQLLLLGDRAQIIVPASMAVTPKTFQPALASTYEADPECPPIAVDDSAMIAFSHGSTTGVREYFVQGTNRLNKATLLSVNVPRLMRGRPLQMSACLSESTLFVLSESDPSLLFVYRWAVVNGERVQSAWGYWTFAGDIMSHRVIGGTLWMVINRHEGPCLESLQIEPWSMTEIAPFPILLDRKISIGPARFRPNGWTPPAGDDGTPDPEGGGDQPGDPPGGGGDPPDEDPPDEDPPDEDPPRPPGPWDDIDQPVITNPGNPAWKDLDKEEKKQHLVSASDWERRARMPINVTADPNPLVTSGTGYRDAVAPLVNVSEAGTAANGVFLVSDGSGESRGPHLSRGFDANDQRERGIASYDPTTNLTTVQLPWMAVWGTAVVRADDMRRVQWYPGPGANEMTLKGDYTNVPLYAGLMFEMTYRFGAAVITKPNRMGGQGAIRTGRLQIIRWHVAADPSGPFDLQVIRDGVVVKNKRLVHRRIGWNRNVPSAVSGFVNVGARADRARVQIVNRTTWPSWFTCAEWQGDYNRDNRLI